MASSAGKLKTWAVAAAPVFASAAAYAAYQLDAAAAVKTFFTGPGSYSRIVALSVVMWNWKSLPFAWTVRVLGAIISHLFFRKTVAHKPDSLFHPVITESHTTLLEVDYNLHKSNSTYFADLDVSRTHLIGHTLQRGIHALGDNARHRLVMDPSDPSRPARGKFGIMLGAVHCSFKREIKPYQKFEMWSRILAWDRKWVYIVTHFVEKGAVRPRCWHGGVSYGPTRKSEGKPEEWEKKIFATAVSKYVLKVGRLTVHPAVALDASGLLPERPGGWLNTEDEGAAPAVNGDAAVSVSANGNLKTEWTWKDTEMQLQKGLEYARHFATMDELHGHFDGGEEGALGQFSIG